MGKSNLVARFSKNEYVAESQQTIGFEFATQTLPLNDGRIIKAQIWDTAGQERYQSLTSAYYRGAVGGLVCYDISHRSSFENLTMWMKQLRQYAHHKIVLMLVGTKSDQAGSRQVSEEEAKAFASQHNMESIETSALDATNVQAAFKTVINNITAMLPPAQPSTGELPDGWKKVASRTRPGEVSYENQYTKERVAFVPTEPAMRSHGQTHLGSVGIDITVTKEEMDRISQRKLLRNKPRECPCGGKQCNIQ